MSRALERPYEELLHDLPGQAVLNVDDLANMLTGGDVTVESGSLAQDIEIDAALSWTSTHRLTLDSYHSISFNFHLL